MNTANLPLDTTYTDVYGRYIFAGIAPSSYIIHFDAPLGWTYTAANQGINDETDSDVLSTGKTETFMLSENDNLMSIDAGIYMIAPLGSAALGDYVWFDENLNGLQDGEEAGVAGVTVILLNNLQVPIDTTATDANGHYQFTQLVAGNYYVRFYQFAFRNEHYLKRC